jgi:type II secretory pathway pseudopilin PulG
MEQNKTGKYFKYAIGEIVLVVIGILIALSINNWNENQKKSASEKTILNQLNQEFVKNKSNLEDAIKSHKQTINLLNRFISLFPISLDDPTILDSLNTNYIGTNSIKTFNPSNSVINALSNNSSFDIISNKELRFLLQSWHAVLEDFIEEEKVMVKYLHEIHLPYLKEMGISIPMYFRDKRLDLTFITQPAFESRMKYRRGTITRLGVEKINEKSILDNLIKSIDKIIELTKG